MSFMTMDEVEVCFRIMEEVKADFKKNYSFAGVNCNCCGEEMTFHKSKPEDVYCSQCDVQFVDGKFSDMGAKNE